MTRIDRAFFKAALTKVLSSGGLVAVVASYDDYDIVKAMADKIGVKVSLKTGKMGDHLLVIEGEPC